MHRTLAALLVVPLLGLPVSTAQAAPAMEVSLSRGEVAVSSLNTVPVTVTVKGSYAELPYHKGVFVQFKRTSGTGPLAEFSSMALPLVEGDGTPGVWKGTVNVPSTANGIVEATTVDGYEFVPGEPASDPAPVLEPPKLTVNGVHIPKVVSLLTPKVVPYDKPWSVRYTVLDSQTGKPYGTRIRMWFGYEEYCLGHGPGSGQAQSVLTDTNGNFVRSFDANRNGDWTSCVNIPGKPTTIASLKTRVRRPAAISAAPSKTSAPVGTIVPVNGTVIAGAGCQVVLQRLYGATAWREVGSGKVRDSDRFTLNAQPPYKGTIYYRAYLPASAFCSPDKVPGPSNTFTIRGT